MWGRAGLSLWGAGLDPAAMWGRREWGAQCHSQPWLALCCAPFLPPRGIIWKNKNKNKQCAVCRLARWQQPLLIFCRILFRGEKAKSFLLDVFEGAVTSRTRLYTYIFV